MGTFRRWRHDWVVIVGQVWLVFGMIVIIPSYINGRLPGFDRPLAYLLGFYGFTLVAPVLLLWRRWRRAAEAPMKRKEG